MIHLKWTITQLQKYRDKGLILDEKLDVSDLKELDKQIRDVSEIQVSGKADISPSKVTFHLHLKGEYILPCSRTLVDVSYPIDIKTTETFLLKADYEPDEDNVYVVEGDVIDLVPIIKENLLLEVPMQVFCEEANPKGAAPQSGNDWTVLSEDAVKQEKKVDPRLAGLAKFFEDEK